MKTKWANIFVMLLLVIVGFFFILYPENSLKMAVFFLGIGLILLGAVIGISYLVKKEKDKKDLISAIFGGLLIVAGILDLILQDTVLRIFPTIAGILIVVGGIAGFVQAIRHKQSMKNWKSTLAVALASVALGVIVFIRQFDEGTILRILGTALLYLGAVGVVNYLEEPAPENREAKSPDFDLTKLQ